MALVDVRGGGGAEADQDFEAAGQRVGSGERGQRGKSRLGIRGFEISNLKPGIRGSTSEQAGGEISGMPGGRGRAGVSRMGDASDAYQR
jgi:hypothetical protein